MQVPDAGLSDDCPIWVLWFQGEARMPSLVKACFESIKRHKGAHQLHLITSENYRQFVDIPQHFIDKVNDGRISFTHFSDILRNALLSKVGGIWLDATIYLTDEIRKWNLPMNTIRWTHSKSNKFVSACRWTGFCMGAVKGNPLNAFTYDLFDEHHKKGRPLLDYFMIDYTYAFAYENLPVVRQMIDSITVSNEDLYYLRLHQEDAYDNKTLEEVLKRGSIFKMSWKNAPSGANGTLGRYILDGKI